MTSLNLLYRLGRFPERLFNEKIFGLKISEYEIFYLTKSKTNMVQSQYLEPKI